jgi:3-hydroxyisobutyrate dehydrogenase-like beta-hydroxyacid dehydrogenase
MGSAVGAALVRGGARVVVTLEGRSARTRRLTQAAGLTVLGDLRRVVEEADVVLSIGPPDAARAIALDVRRAAGTTRARPLVADLNAIAPATAKAIGAELAEGGLALVDGSISGPPPWKPGTRLYLSGERAAEIERLPMDGVERIVVGEEIGTASAVKMCTASIYKGTSALLAHALLTADAGGVLGPVLDDLRRGAPELVVNVERRLANAAAKSERYVGEMHEIARTQAAAELTPALFEAMADVYAALATSELGLRAPEEVPGDLPLDDVLARLAPRKEDG